jgi:cytochrome P450
VSAPTSRLDVGDPAFQADPYPQLAELRESTAIAWHEPSGRWLLPRFAEVHDALRDRRLGRIHAHRYTAEELGVDPTRPTVGRVLGPRAVVAAQPGAARPHPHPPPRLQGLHAAVGRGAAARRRGAGREHVGRCVTQERFDVVGDLAQPYSVEVICSMLGVDPADTAQLLDWSHAIVKMYELTATEAQRRAADRAAAEFMGYAQELIAERRARPDDRLVSRLVSVEDEGARLSDHEVACTVMVLLEAGHEATVNTMGNGVRALLVHPEQWRRVARAEVAARTAVEEMIRWDAPLQLFERWVLDEGVEIAGQELPIGSKVAMLFGSANRDPRRFADPDRFDAGRGDTAHIGFGGGIHFCVGAPLARLELEVALDELRRRAPDLSLAEEPTYHPTFVIHGLTALRVIAG